MQLCRSSVPLICTCTYRTSTTLRVRSIAVWSSCTTARVVDLQLQTSVQYSDPAPPPPHPHLHNYKPLPFVLLWNFQASKCDLYPVKYGSIMSGRYGYTLRGLAGTLRTGGRKSTRTPMALYYCYVIIVIRAAESRNGLSDDFRRTSLVSNLTKIWQRCRDSRVYRCHFLQLPEK